MKKTVMSLVTLLVIGTSTGFCKTNVSNNNINGNLPRTENVVKVSTPDKNKEVKPVQEIKKQEPKKTDKCTCRKCQKQKKQMTKVSKVGPQKHVQLKK